MYKEKKQRIYNYVHKFYFLKKYQKCEYIKKNTPSVGDFDEWAIKLKITTYPGAYS